MTAGRFIYLVVITCITAAEAIPLSTADSTQEVEVEYLPHRQSHRHKRSSTDDLHAEMHFRLTSNRNDVTLRLRRSVMNQPSDIPVYVIRGNGVVKEDLPNIQNAASYLDKSMGAAILVRKIPNGNYTLEGSYHDQNGRVHIHPQGGIVHEIRRIAEVAYGNDFVITTDVPPRLSAGRSSVRSRRQAMNEYTIGILMCADWKDFSHWMTHLSNQTLAKNAMRQFYAVAAQSMALRYSSVTDVDPRLKINIQITGLLIVDSPENSYWTENVATIQGTVEVRPALRSFKDWVRAQNSLPSSDHWMLFSGYDLTSDGDKVVTGLATLAAMCTQASVSIIEQDFSASVGATAAHELGHSLSAVHDGSGLAGSCPDSDNYIMSSKLVNPTENITASRPWEFSSCSILAFRRYLARVYCAREPDNHLAPFVSSDMKNFQPGQVYSSDIQCKLALGNKSYFARGIQYDRGFDTMCTTMFCAIPGRPRFFQRMFAMEKTTCGDGKWCMKGRCVDDPEAPRTPENCPQGDDLEENCKVGDCPYFTSKARIAYCCHTCGSLPNVTLHTLPADPATTTQSPVQQEGGRAYKGQDVFPANRGHEFVPVKQTIQTTDPPLIQNSKQNGLNDIPQRSVDRRVGTGVPSIVQGVISSFRDIFERSENSSNSISRQREILPVGGSSSAGLWLSQFLDNPNPSGQSTVKFISNTPRPLASSGDSLSSIYGDPSRFRWSVSNVASSRSRDTAGQSTDPLTSIIDFISNPRPSSIFRIRNSNVNRDSAGRNRPPEGTRYMIPSSSSTSSRWGSGTPQGSSFNIVTANRASRPPGSDSGFLSVRRTDTGRTFCVSCASSWTSESVRPRSFIIQTVPRRSKPRTSISWVRRSSMRSSPGATIDTGSFRTADLLASRTVG